MDKGQHDKEIWGRPIYPNYWINTNMEIKDQEATPEQKAAIKKLHNEEVKRSRITAYIIGALACIGLTFLLRLDIFKFIVRANALNEEWSKDGQKIQSRC